MAALAAAFALLLARTCGPNLEKVDARVGTTLTLTKVAGGWLVERDGQMTKTKEVHIDADHHD